MPSESVIKNHKWGITAVIMWFVSLFLAETGIGVIIAIAELVFFAASLKAISDINMQGGVIRGLGILGLVAFLGLWGFATLFAGLQISAQPKMYVSGISVFYLGLLTVIVAAFTYYELKYRREKAYTEKKIETEAYLKRKGELEAEREYK